MRDFDDVLEEIGPFGPFQITVFVLVSLFETPTAWAMFLQVFVAADQPWICSSSLHATENNGSAASGTSYGNLTFGYERTETESLEERCRSVTNGTCGDIVFVGDFTTIVSEWNLVCDLDFVKPLVMTLQMVGVLVGAVVVGQLADTYGRRNVYFVVYASLLVVFFGSAFANSWQIYAACRTVIGALIGGTMVVNFVLPLEVVGRKWRTFCGCIGFWACGVMTLAPLAFFIRDWRNLTLTCSTVGLPMLLSYWFVPESPRWLIQKGRLAEAEKIIRLIARRNKRPYPDLSHLNSYVKKEKEVEMKLKRYGFWDLFRNLTMTKNTLIMMYAWFVSSSVYYGTSLNVGNLSGNRYINFFLSGLVEIPALLLVVLINNKIGRKKTLALLMSVAGCSCFAILFIDLAGKLQELSGLTTALAMLGKSGISGGWAAAQVYAAEVFPTVVRNIGVGVSSMSARVGGILAPQIVALNRFSRPVPFVVFGVLGIVCALLCVFLPETLDVPLPDAVPPRQCCLGRRRRKKPADDRTTSSVTDTSTVVRPDVSASPDVDRVCAGAPDGTFTDRDEGARVATRAGVVDETVAAREVDLDSGNVGLIGGKLAHERTDFPSNAEISSSRL